MKITIDHNAHEISANLVRAFAREVPFATSRAINTVVKKAQGTQREGMRKRFTIRRPAFFERAVKIKPFATKQTLEATITIDPPGGQARADILIKFEEGGQKTARSGQLAVPVQARPSKTAMIPAKLRPRALNLRGSGRVLRGDQGTFLIRGEGGEGGTIFQNKAGRTVVLYTLKRAVPIEPDLKFVETIREVVRDELPRALRDAFFQAIHTVR